MMLTLTALHLAVLIFAAVLFATAAFSDVRSYRIPNPVCGLLLLLFPFYVASSPSPVDWRQNIVVFGAAALIGVVLFLCNMMGAGDIKLLSVASLWAGPHLIALFLLVTAFAGGVESLALVAVRGSKIPKSERMQKLAKTKIPYGVAIATGGVTMLGAMARPLLMSD
ncbi:MAG: prepilin peptidase [Bdellovibrionales bacterium]